MRTLLVEDDIAIAEDMATCLTGAGFKIDVCHDGEEAWFRGDTEAYDAVVLDLGLPKLDGLTVLKRWRNEGRTMPVIILTARDGWTERVDGINAGADDYLTKPFQMEELIARVRALVRRVYGHAGPKLEAGPVTLDTTMMRISVNGRTVPLTPLEFRLASYLLHNKGRVVSGSNLLEHVYGDDDSREINAIEALIGRLRRKLGADTIETRRGHGYCFRTEVG